MDITPMEEAMMQQFSVNVHVQAVQETVNSSSPNPTAQQTDTVTVKKEEAHTCGKGTAVQDSSDDVTVLSEFVPVTVKTEEIEEENAAQAAQEAKSGDDHNMGDEGSDNTSTENVTKDDGSETVDVQDDKSDGSAENVEDKSSSDNDIVCEPGNDRIDSVEESLAKDDGEMMSDPCKDTTKGKQPFSCSQCSKHFKTRRTFETHMKKTHKVKFLHCRICKKGYESQEVLDEHLLKLHNVKKRNRGRGPRFVGPFTCDRCKKEFEIRKKFTNHVKRCGTLFACQSCTKVFERPDSLKNHTDRYHSDVPPQHQCEVCGKQFYKKDKLRRHQVTHNPAGKQSQLIKKFKCETCSNAYCSRTELEIHTRTHTGEKPCLCEHCGKCFTCQRDARKHILRMHSNWKETAKLHYCSVCNKGFLEKSNMLKHVSAVHADNRPFPCDQCEYRGKNKRDLQRHQARHMAEKPFSCLVCDRKYNSKEALNYHKRAHHGMDKTYKCKDCGTEFHVREAYNHHMKSHKRAAEIDTVLNLVVERQTADAVEENKKGGKPEAIVKDKEEVAATSQEVATLIFVPLSS